MTTPDPGIDLHEFETLWEEFQEDLAGSPAESLAQLDDLIKRMLVTAGFPVDDELADELVDPEILATYRAAHECRLRVDAGEDVDPGDVASAIEGFTALYETVVAERPSA